MGPWSITSRHTDCTPWPLKSRHFRTAVHCSPSLISCASSSGRKSGSGPGFQHKAVPFPGIPLTKHTCTKMLVIFPFHAHLPNDERGDAFQPKTLFSHSCRWIRRRQQANRGWKKWVKLKRRDIWSKAECQESNAAFNRQKNGRHCSSAGYWLKLYHCSFRLRDYSCSCVWVVLRLFACLCVHHSPLAWLSFEVGVAQWATGRGSVQNS